MANNICDQLSKRGFVPEQGLMIRKMLTAKEAGKVYKLDMGKNGMLSAVYAVDGYIVPNNRDNSDKKCDKLVLVDKLSDNSWSEIFVELKGSDIKQAIDQLKSTIELDIFKHPSVVERKARIVAGSFPANRNNVYVEEFRRWCTQHACEYKPLKSTQPDTI